MAASFCLLVSAAVGLSGESTGPGKAETELRAKGWSMIDQVNCEGLSAGSFYEIGNDEASAEIYGLPPGGFLASRLPLPEAPYECREITAPQFVEEIR